MYWRLIALTPETSQIGEECPNIQRVDLLDCAEGVPTLFEPQIEPPSIAFSPKVTFSPNLSFQSLVLNSCFVGVVDVK